MEPTLGHHKFPWVGIGTKLCDPTTHNIRNGTHVLLNDAHNMLIIIHIRGLVSNLRCLCLFAYNML